MICERCKKNPASVRMEQGSNGTKKDIYICDECSNEIEMSLLLDDIFHGIFNHFGKIHAIPISHLGQFLQSKERNTAQPKITCQDCGITFDELKNGSILGCATCYKAFHTILEPLLMNVHGSVAHEGRIPKRTGASLKRERQVDILRQHMQQAVAEEDFSRAAFLRDQIKRLDSLPVHVDNGNDND